jgi:AcrR family transcriptional regulator
MVPLECDEFVALPFAFHTDLMKTQKGPALSPRKRPQQARSTQLVADILSAAIRVLEVEGAHRFTMARVAAKTGVSVGSVYQYFPNKEAILFQLQTDEWRATHDLLERILSNAAVPPFERLRTAVRTFFRTECEELKLRVALRDAAPLYRHAPAGRQHRGTGLDQMRRFLKEAFPDLPADDLTFLATLTVTCTSAIGKKISEEARPQAEVEALATAVADMLCSYLRSQGRRKVQRGTSDGATVSKRSGTKS